ncbi:MAG: PQQ-binding-like beta-propeller repeat protein [Acidimicrobiales bacterium]|nr:PQQ-binding-like beta-propeller repeat protein [Acidimicrobiales bacterium]
MRPRPGRPPLRPLGLAATAVVLALLAAACSADPSDDAAPRGGSAAAVTTTTEPPPPAGTPAELVEHADDWPTAGQDLRNTRTAARSTITTDNVDELRETWRAGLEGAGALTTVPIVQGDTVYLQAGFGAVHALDRATGDVRWASEPRGLNIGPFGVAVGDGRVYGMDASTGVVALDATDGAEAWVTDITATDTTGVDIQPVIADGTVLASSVPISIGGIYAPGDRGVVSALDAATGEVRWTFDTVKGDLWGHPEVNSGGGVWYPPVVDLERRLVYAGVANPAPFPGTPEFPNGTSRPGPNLYTNSIVALDLDTGELAWFHQVVPHDIFDRDQVHTLMARLDDGTDVIVSAGKSGIVVGLDPDDGTVRWTTEVGHHDNDDLTELDGPTVVAPGTYGGVLTPPATADGVVYLATVDAPTELQPDETAYFGAPLGSEDGEVTAVSAGTGEVLWATEVPGDPLGGAAVVNDLVFTALLDGTLLALDRDTGEIVWTGDAGGGVNGWMAVAGDELFVPVGNADPPALLHLSLE